MTFLAIIIAVLLLQAWGTAERTHYDNWFENWRTRVESWGLGVGLSVILTVFLPALVVQMILDSVQTILFGLAWLLGATFLLLYSIGRGDFQATMAQYRGYAYAGDFEAAYLAAGQVLDWGSTGDPPNSAPEVHERVQRALLYEGFQHWFTIMFYFVMLGPAGALAYRLTQLQRGAPESDTAFSRQLLFVLDWVPARLLACTFALTGDFNRSRDDLLAGLRAFDTDASELLYPVGLAALGSEVSAAAARESEFGTFAAAQNREFDALLSRSAVCWIVILALLVLVF